MFDLIIKFLYDLRESGCVLMSIIYKGYILLSVTGSSLLSGWFRLLLTDLHSLLVNKIVRIEDSNRFITLDNETDLIFLNVVHFK